ncbi:MAG: hypothetical protein ACP5NY_04040 [Thermocladium sp.]
MSIEKRGGGSLLDTHYEECIGEAYSILTTRQGRDSPINHPLSEFIDSITALAMKCTALLNPHIVLMREQFELVLMSCLRRHGFNAVDGDPLKAVRSCVVGKTPRREPATQGERIALYESIIYECLVPALECIHSAATEYGLARRYGQPG